jgi:hypothetical protein
MGDGDWSGGSPIEHVSCDFKGGGNIGRTDGAERVTESLIAKPAHLVGCRMWPGVSKEFMKRINPALLTASPL